MYESNNPIDELVHLYVDGAFDRRELVRRVARLTGSVAAAVTALAGFEELHAQSTGTCPAGIQVPADAPDLIAQDVTFPGQGGSIQGYYVYSQRVGDRQPAVIVIHENRGLVEHIRDVTRRVARAGYVALAVDLLSRQGGTAQFTDPTQQVAAYNRTNQTDRRLDLTAGLDFLKRQSTVQFNRIGAVGFCAGGGNVWDLVVSLPELAAAVPFYGAPPATDQLDRIQTPVLALYAERDRALTQRMLTTANDMLTRQKTLGMVVYEGVGHAFHNDTGAAYNAAAACDAWARTTAFFDKYLQRTT